MGVDMMRIGPLRPPVLSLSACRSVQTGFVEDRDQGWSSPVLIAQASMGLFPRMPRRLSRALVLPLHVLHRLWWKLGYAMTRTDTAGERHRVFSTAGSFVFVARKGCDAEA